MEEYLWISKLTRHPLIVHRVQPVLRRLAEEYDVRVTVAGPDDASDDAFVQAVSDGVGRRVSGMMIVGWEAPGLTVAMDAAISGNIPVVTVDADCDGCRRMAYVGADWRRTGGMMADKLAILAGGQGRVLLLGAAGLSSVGSAHAGFCARVAAYPNMNVIGFAAVSMVEAEGVAAHVHDLLRSYGEFSCLAVFDGIIGSVATEALIDAGRADRTALVCVDPDEMQIQRLRGGVIDAAFVPNREANVNHAFQLMYSFNHGSPATGYRPGLINIPQDIDTGLVIITKDNVDSLAAEVSIDDASARHELIQRLTLISGVAENCAELTLATDPEGHVVYANLACQRFLGHTDGQLRESSFDTIFGLDGAEKSRVIASLAAGEQYSFETVIADIRGAGVPFQVRVSPLRTDTTTRGMVFTATDISERKRSEEALRRERDLVAGFMETSPVGIVFVNRPGNFAFANARAEQILGLVRNGRTERSYNVPEWRIIDNDGRPLPEEQLPLSQVKHTKQAVWDIRFAIEWPAGRRVLLSINAAPVLDGAGEVDGIVATLEDITERTAAEQALRDSEAQSRAILYAIPDLIFQIDRKGIFCSYKADRSEDLYAPPETFLGKNVREILPADLARQTLEYVDRALRTNELQIYEYQLAIGGELRHYEARMVVCGSDMVLTMVRDITGRKRAEQALRESEERFRTAFRTSPDSININRLDNGRYVDVNEGFTALTGFTHEDAIGKTSLEIAIWHDTDDRQRLLTGLETNGYVRNLEATFRLKDGRLRTGLMSARIMTLNGEPHILSVTRDIEDWKQAEAARRESEERFRAVFETAQDTIFIKNRRREYVAVNPAMVQLFGIPAATMIRRTDDDLFDADTAAQTQSFDRRALEGEIVNEEFIGTIRGEGRVLHLVLVPMRDAAGEITGICGIARDVTETKRLQDLAERAERLETAGRIAGQVAHDFNNLLGPLIAYPGFMREELPADHPVIQYLNDMEKAAEQIADINQQLLTLGRRGHYTQEPINVNETIRQVVEQGQPYPKTLRITARLGRNLMKINGGAAQVYRVVSNLIANARDAMNDAGELIIKTENYYMDAAFGRYGHVPRGEYVKITISDTGCGIPEETLPRIFDPFFTTKAADKRRGSGLGLSVVHAVVEDHDGFIDVMSTVGKGTTFYLYFPITRVAPDTSRVKVIERGTESVLVVDDDPTQREVTVRLLEKLGYRARAVESGEEALEFLQREAQDLLLIDMVMPGIDGTETYRRVLTVNPLQKAVIVSGFAETKRVKEAFALGAGGFLRKPLTLKSLGSAIRQELDRTVEKPA